LYIVQCTTRHRIVQKNIPLSCAIHRRRNIFSRNFNL